MTAVDTNSVFRSSRVLRKVSLEVRVQKDSRVRGLGLQMLCRPADRQLHRYPMKTVSSGQ